MQRIQFALVFVFGLAVGGLSVPVALAGFSEDNIYISLHRNPGDSEAVYELRLHRGSQSVDTVSAEFDSAEFYQLKSTAVMGQTDFDGAATNILGSWYSSLSTSRKAEFRSAFIDAC